MNRDFPMKIKEIHFSVRGFFLTFATSKIITNHLIINNMKRIALFLVVALMGAVSVMAQDNKCERCEGKGYIRCTLCNGKTEMCKTCKGLGNIICRSCKGESKTCPVCHGSKYYNNATCWTCKGKGSVIDCNHCDGKGYEKCPLAPKYCFNGDEVCARCDGLKNIPCPDCQK